MSLAQITYYSRDGGTQDWDLNTSWTLSSDGIGAPAGPPGVNDYVIILNSHTILVDDITDNGGAGQSADGLDSANVGEGPSYTIVNDPFPDSSTPNFFHNGEMTVEEGGTLTFATRVMFDGTIFIAGTLTTSFDIIILGNLYFAPSATFSSTDDLICSGNSNTRIDIPDAANAWTSDDIYIDHTDAFICGLGDLGIGRAGGTGHIINLRNSATLAQLCTILDIVGCDPNPPLNSPCPSGTTVYNPSIPTLAGAGGTINYIENDTLTIADNITVTYAEPLPYLTAATVTISGGTYVDGEDILRLPGISTIVAVFDTGTGTLNLAGYGDVSRWQTALQSITYENLSDNPTTTTRTIEFQVDDGFNLSNPPISRNITIQAVNDPPDASILGSPGALVYVEDSGPVPADPLIEIEDVDNDDLVGATITILPYVSGEDYLDFADAHGVQKVSFIGGVLILDQTTLVEDYELALQEVTYTNTSDNPNTAPRTVSFVINDGADVSDPWNRIINITTTNDAPVNTVPGAQNVDEDAVLTFAGNISIDDIDAGTDDLTITLSVSDGILDFSSITGLTSVTDNAATIIGTGTITEINAALNGLTYTPTADYVGGDILVVNTSDNGNNGSGGVQTDIDNITITVDPINDAPLNTIPGGQNVDEDAVLTFAGNITIDDIDAGTDDLTITLSVSDGILDFSTITGLTSVTDNAATIIGTGTITEINTALNGLTYTPTADYVGGDILVVNTSDNGNNGSGGVQTDIDNIIITVDPTNNDAPVNTVPGAQNVDEDAVLTFAGNITIDDIDAGTDVLTITLSVSDGILDFISITGLTSVTDNAATIIGTGTITEINTALNGLTYTPTADYVGGDLLVVNTNDNGNNGSGGVQSDIDNIIITVDPINDAPLNTIPGAQNVDEDAVLTFAGNITIDDIDAGTDDLTITLSVSDGILDFSTITGLTSVTDNAATIIGTGTITEINTALNGLTYTPTADYVGGDLLVINTSDNGNNGSGGVQTDIDNIIITVDPINDAPLNTIPGAQNVDEDAVLTFAGNISIDDIDAGTDDLTITLSVSDGILDFSTITGLTSVTDNAATIISTGTITEINTALNGLTYTATADYAGGDILVVNTNDNGNNGSGGVQTDIDNVIITVDQINDEPVATDMAVSTDEDTDLDVDLVALVSDIDDALDLTKIDITGPTNGTISNINTITGVVTYTPTADYNGGDSFTYTIDDVSGGTSNLGTITITVNPINDVPVAIDQSVTTNEDIDLDVDLSALVTDIDDAIDLTTITISTAPTNGTISNINTTTGVVTYSPNINYNGGDSFTYTINDASGGTSNIGTITITVNALNDVPVATDLSVVTNEDTDLDVDLSALVTDTDDALDLLTIAIVTSPTNGTISNINTATGVVTYTPDANYNGGDSFTFTIDDVSGGTSNLATITITVNPINDVPVATDQSVATDEDTDLDVDLSTLVADIDDAIDLTTITIGTAPTNGTISNINTTTGVVTYSPNINYNGGDSFTFTIDDVSGGTSNLATITITVNPINDVPVATDQIVATDEDTDLDIDLSALVTDIDDALDLTTITIGTAPINGTISNINTTTGVVIYTPNADYNGGDSFTYTIDDASAGTSNLGIITITVDPINDLPTLIGNGTSLAYTEGDGGVLLDNGLIPVDADNLNLASATITISANYQSPEDVLAFADQNGISGSYAAGVLTLTGSATIANYQTALRSITYENTSQAPNTNTRTVDIIVNDGFGNSLPFSRQIIIAPIIEAPVIFTAGGFLTATIDYTEGDGDVALLPGLTVNDPDDINLEGATFMVANNYTEIEDILGYVDQSGITGSFNSSIGVLTLTGQATLTTYQAVLRTITYTNTSDRPDINPRTISATVNDGDITSNAITITVNILPINDAPVVDGSTTALLYPESSGPIAIDDLVLTSDIDSDELQSAKISVSGNYIPDEDILGFNTQSGISGSFDANTGVLSLTGTASISDYQAALRSVTYENPKEIADLNIRTVDISVNDGFLESNIFSREIIIEEVEDPVIVYQVVTPDGDSFNDTWVIDGIDQFPNNVVSVFNRYNSIVYKSESYSNHSNSWAGEANEGFGKGELPDGTYFYTVNLGDGSDILEGFVVLKRK